MAHIILRLGTDRVTTFTIDTLADETHARKMLREHGIAYEPIWVGEPGSPDALRTQNKLFAAEPEEWAGQSPPTDDERVARLDARNAEMTLLEVRQLVQAKYAEGYQAGLADAQAALQQLALKQELKRG